MNKEEVFEEVLEYFKGDSLAANVWIDKYSLKDKEGDIKERTPNDMHLRLAREFARIEANYPNPMKENEIFELLKGFKYIVPQGSPMSGVGNPYSITSLSNCFVIGNNGSADSYGSIFRTDEEQVQLMKRRGGVGHDISHLRPAGSLANNAILADVAGTTLYMERFSNSTREVSQGDRRGALMLSIDVRHPDTDKFIDAKLEQGRVTGANISVKITDEFMNKVERDGDFYQTFPIDLKIPYCGADYNKISDLEYNKLLEVEGGYIKKIKAKELWNKIIQNAHKSAEPGVLFWDTIQRESPADCYGYDWKSVSTNPCLTGDTIVAVADGRNGISIKELSDIGGNFIVYSARKNKSTGNHGGGWKTEIKEAIAFKTGNKKVVEVILSDGTSFKCTEDHLLATRDCKYIQAADSLGVELGKFYSFSNKNSGQHYRHINSKSNGHSKQYVMIWEYYNGIYDGKEFNIDHKNCDSTNDFLENLQKLTIKEHKDITLRFGDDNPIKKIVGSELHRLMNKRKNILANATRYNWGEDRKQLALNNFDEIYGETIESLKPEDCNIYLDESIFVKDIIELGFEDVYDLKVEDNQNFYIITNTDDDKYLNCSGVLVHNCGEIPLCPEDSCRLMAINLYSYVNKPFTTDSSFDYELFKDHVIKAQRLMDDLVDLEIEKINKIIEKIKSDPEPEDLKKVELSLWERVLDKAVQGRRTGLGITGEGDMLAALGIRYASKEGINMSEAVHRHMAVASYTSSIIMAEERGCFPIWNKTLEFGNPFIRRIISEIYGDRSLLEKYYNSGRRNIANLTCAPTGTVSLMTQTTSGIEPCFQPYYIRRRKTNIKEKAVFTDEKGDMWEEYPVFHHKFKVWYDLNPLKKEGGFQRSVKDSNGIVIDFQYEVYSIEELSKEQLGELVKKSPYHEATANDINWVDKVRMQGAVQKWIDHSISATTNLPKETTIETVEEIYMTAWREGCKGHTIYRDGCRDGVLLTNTAKDSDFKYIDAFKRPKVAEVDIYHKTALKKDWMVIIGKENTGKPIEIFAILDVDNSTFPISITKGTLTKTKSKHYKLVGKQSDKEYSIENIIDLMPKEDQVDTRKYSLMLRHGIHPKFIYNQIEEYAIINSFDKVVQRVLSKYLTDKDLSMNKCPECGEDLSFENGCVSCKNCGFSKCG